MAIYFGIMGGLIVAIYLVSLSAYRLSKGNKEGRRIMDRFYFFVDIASIGVKNGDIGKEQEQALILDIKEAIVGGSVVERLRALDGVMDRSCINGIRRS